MASLYELLQGQNEDDAYNRLAAMRQSYMPSQFQQAATPMNYRVNANPMVRGMQNGQPNYGYGNRYSAPTADLTKGKYGVETRPLYFSEKQYFKKNPHVGGMAADDNAVIINPYSTLNDRERQAIVMNESARVHMRTGNIAPPTFDITPEQQTAFKSYSSNLNDIKQTIAARVLSGDPSALNKTSAQIDYANQLKNYMAGPNIPQPKGTGYYGEVARPEGGFSGELSVDTGYGDIPSMVPGLTPNEMQSVLTAGEGQQFPESVYRKASSHAAFRKLNGLAAFAGLNDQPSLLPSRSGTMMADLYRN